MSLSPSSSTSHDHPPQQYSNSYYNHTRKINPYRYFSNHLLTLFSQRTLNTTLTDTRNKKPWLRNKAPRQAKKTHDRDIKLSTNPNLQLSLNHRTHKTKDMQNQKVLHTNRNQKRRPSITSKKQQTSISAMINPITTQRNVLEDRLA